MTFSTLISKHRSAAANQRLGQVLAFVAGYVNAGGFFVVRHYTSHMTGILSIAADHIAVGNFAAAVLMLVFMASFVLGAVTTTAIVIDARRLRLHSQYALPLLLEAVLISGIIWMHETSWLGVTMVTATVALLCFVMGLQNALITKASNAIIRTTHVTGMTTDLGIEIGKILYSRRHDAVVANQQKAWLHFSIILSFFVGGVIGAVTLAESGLIGLLPIIALLVFLAAPAIGRDYRFWVKWRRRKKRG